MPPTFIRVTWERKPRVARGAGAGAEADTSGNHVQGVDVPHRVGTLYVNNVTGQLHLKKTNQTNHLVTS